MAWQFLSVQTVYGCNITALAMSHSCRLVQVILMNFTALKTGTCLLIEATVGSTIEVNQKLFKQHHHVGCLH